MKQLTSLEIHYLIGEFKELIDSKVDKIYSPSKKELLIQFYVSGKGKKILKVDVPYFICLTEKKEQSETPSGFCMFLRKKLDGSRLRGIKQLDSERIVEMVFERKEGKFFLMIELFSKGNIILCDESKKIIALTEKQKWKDRILDINQEYQYPKKSYNFLKVKESDLVKMFKESDKESVVKSLAIELGFGGAYSEELCLLSDIDKKKKPGELNKDDIKKLSLNIKKIIDKPVKVLSAEIEPVIKKEKIAKSKEHEKTINILKKQKERIAKIKEEIKENNEKAELIYQKYQLIGGVLKEIKKAREKYSWAEIEGKLKGNKIIKKVISKDSKIIVEV